MHAVRLIGKATPVFAPMIVLAILFVISVICDRVEKAHDDYLNAPIVLPHKAHRQPRVNP